MEPAARRRRRSRQLVAAFLRDPGSGRVYRRGKLIGKGAFSRCYKLTDMSNSAVFALKVVPRSGSGAGRLRPRGKVEREIALHSGLRHSNIVAFHGHFADRDHVYMVLEYCGRQSLAHVLKARQTLTEPEVRYYLRGVVSGLRYLHQRRIVHRDLKLSNFFLNNSMEVKIGDLGLAARVGPGGRCHRVLCGTPNFLAPEVVSRNGHTCQSDIWALGCVLDLASVHASSQFLLLRGGIRNGDRCSRAPPSGKAAHKHGALPPPTLCTGFPTMNFWFSLTVKMAMRGKRFESIQDIEAAGTTQRKTLMKESARAASESRYTALTGSPPFPVAPPSEMYQSILDGRYPEPAHLSPSARHLIARLLAPNPAERPSLDQLLQDDFFTQGFTPERLPPHSCHSPPNFAVPRPLDSLFRKVGRLLLAECRLPRPFTPKEDSGAGAEGLEPDPMERGGEVALSERRAPDPEGPVHLLTQGALRSDPAGPEGSPRLEVEAAIRKLQLCLNAGPAATWDPPGEQQPVLCAPMWVDYSSKYGFGYQLSDGGSAVLFRDGTHMALRPPGRGAAGREGVHRPGAPRTETHTPPHLQPSLLPAHPREAGVVHPEGRAKLAWCQARCPAALYLLHAEATSRVCPQEGAPPAPPPPAAPGLCLLRFFVSPQVLLLLFSDETVQSPVSPARVRDWLPPLQASFSGTQARLVLSGAGEDLRLTLGQPGRPCTSCSLSALRMRGCSPATRQRLCLALRVLQSS
ncbi:PREDICTED: inactive serine/threonine-protein kinase PLK5 isoform X3 [Chinchilla lanigera]|uniref:inactive serine/threonine-protein kinase PLK5 isoform X3 n=1 Tax=Chinchilla lanigera TaxID=34839 RepID=UPI000698E81B|nr:PREDICTED: inactive serine/threonine-protein kinase PLK5 isoform X3 [Chinchilla lanigera]